MRKLKDFYVELTGHEYDKIKNKSWYLSELALDSAIEVDNYKLGRSNDLSNFQELIEILKEYQLTDSHNALTEPSFPYMPLFKFLRKGSDKDIRKYPEVALEMRLFRYKLEEVLADPKKDDEKLKETVSLLCELNREFANESHTNRSRYGLVA